MNFQNQKIVETKNCQHCKISFDITDKDLNFYDKVSPIFDGEKYSIPTPRFCPECRQQRRLSFRNERNLYKRKCDATGKNIISIFNPEKDLKVYNQDFWWSDNWETLDYGIDFCFEKNSMEQFFKLYSTVPKRAIIKGTGSENCNYVNYLGASKNCYIIFCSHRNQDCYYGNNVLFSTGCVDTTNINNCENSYELIDCLNCTNGSYLQDCGGCNDSQYLFNCKNCTFCFGCINLENKKYYIFNKSYTKENYYGEIEKIKKQGYSMKDFLGYKLGFTYQSGLIINSENATGNIIYNSKNISNSYEIYDGEDISNSCIVFNNSNNIFDTYVGVNHCENIYESMTVNKYCSSIIFTIDCWNNCNNLMYCMECKNCSYCFLSTGMEGKKYCILNKQYTKEQYNILVPKIINHMKNTGEWGEFFPSSLCAFGYNETVAQEYFPLKQSDLTPNPSPLEERGVAQNFIPPSLKGRGLGGGFNWSNYEAPLPKIDKIIPAKNLSLNISEIPDDILNWAIECEITKKPFRIIPQELDFYRKHSLPIPKRHPDQRHLDRMMLRNPRTLYKRGCDNCNIEMSTTYARERQEKIYCEGCYKNEMY